jgi:hypothetical protein
MSSSSEEEYNEKAEEMWVNRIRSIRAEGMYVDWLTFSA